jgi:bifunctional UDP-N-acetylglucosamine pyrophosphorylase / glucosamine-1-phosphate N-acetyltransferase
MQKRLAIELAYAGVTLLDPSRLDIRGSLAVAEDVTLDVNVSILGNVSIDSNTYIGPNCSIKDSHIGKNVKIKGHCVLDGATIADNCEIGPFAHIRPETVLGEKVRIGNFVELKKSHLGEETKVNHLSYVGDAELGKDVNVGAGTITCNYNGVKKQQTIIGDHAFIGSNTSLVAPVKVGANAVIGAGSVITKDAPADQLTLSRSEQKTVEKRDKEK